MLLLDWDNNRHHIFCKCVFSSYFRHGHYRSERLMLLSSKDTVSGTMCVCSSHKKFITGRNVASLWGSMMSFKLSQSDAQYLCCGCFLGRWKMLLRARWPIFIAHCCFRRPRYLRLKHMQSTSSACLVTMVSELLSALIMITLFFSALPSSSAPSSSSGPL